MNRAPLIRGVIVMTIDITDPSPQDNLSLQELSLYHAIMDYRAAQGLAPLPLSAALTTTAARHVLDTRENIWAEGVVLPEGANLHSWSDGFYYSDHRNPNVMWTAPRRVGTDYPSSGYEISAAGFATVDAALQGWINSPSHNAILTGTGVWEGIELRAIGIGLDTSPGAGIYAGRIFHVWFGESADAGIPRILGSNIDDLIPGTTFEDWIYGLDGIDEIRGGLGDDSLFGGNDDDLLIAGLGDDVLYGGAGHDKIWGGVGADTILGGDGDDRLSGGEGADRIIGGLGDDLLSGGLGQDQLTGSEGADVFAFNAVTESLPGPLRRDVITDFTSGEDLIRLHQIDAVAATPALDPLRYVGAALFSGAAGELRVSPGLVQADVDGDARADLQIEVLGVGLLNAGDLFL